MLNVINFRLCINYRQENLARNDVIFIRTKCFNNFIKEFYFAILQVRNLSDVKTMIDHLRLSVHLNVLK